MASSESQLPEHFVQEWKAQLGASHVAYAESRHLINSALVAATGNYAHFALIEAWQWCLAPFRCLTLWVLKQHLNRPQTLGADRHRRLRAQAKRVLDYLEFGRNTPPEAWSQYVRTLICQIDRYGNSESRAMFKWRLRQAFLSYAWRRKDGSYTLREQPSWVFRLGQVSLWITLTVATFLLATGFAELFQEGGLTDASVKRLLATEALIVPILALYHFSYGWKWGYEFLSELDLG